MASIFEYKALFELYLKEHLFYCAPNNLYEPVNYILQLDSKRIRPSLMMAVADMYDVTLQQVMAPALGIEIFHNFTLVHDDVMDKSVMRRGQPTVDTKYGLNAAILSGDVMQILASQKISAVAPDILQEVIALYNRTAIEVCEGQQMDMDFEQEHAVSEMEYLQMIELKTAVLLACSLKLGAIISGASKADQDHLYEFGRNIGIAFQIQDDLLDSFGSEASVGKRIGGDICNNKKTLLLIKALQTQHKYDKEILVNWLQTSEFNEDKVADVKRIFVDSHAKSYTEQRMKWYYDQAIASLHKISKDEKKKQVLFDFSELIVTRKT